MLNILMKKTGVFCIFLCLIVVLPACMAGRSAAAETGTVGKNLSSLFSQGGVPTDPSMLPGGLDTRVPPFFGGDGQPGQQGGQPYPQYQSPQNSGAQPLVGMWIAQNGPGQIIGLLFAPDGSCGFAVNNQQFFGTYTVQGSHLHVQLQNGKSIDVEFSVQGDILRLSDGTVMQRQPMPGVAQQPVPGPAPQQPVSQQPMPGPAPQQPVWGQQPYPQPQGPAGVQNGASPLEGTWGAQTQQGMILFQFQGNQYRCMVNGTQAEAGVFRLEGNRLHFQITQGQMVGQQGVNTWTIQGNVLIMITQNGMSMQFVRQ